MTLKSKIYRNLTSLILFILHNLMALAKIGYFGLRNLGGYEEGKPKIHIEHWYP
jgi:hypothetical protein